MDEQPQYKALIWEVETVTGITERLAIAAGHQLPESEISSHLHKALQHMRRAAELLTAPKASSAQPAGVNKPKVIAVPKAATPKAATPHAVAVSKAATPHAVAVPKAVTPHAVAVAVPKAVVGQTPVAVDPAESLWKQGGDWLQATRGWIKYYCIGGDRVPWGSEAPLSCMTPNKLMQLGAEVVAYLRNQSGPAKIYAHSVLLCEQQSLSPWVLAAKAWEEKKRPNTAPDTCFNPPLTVADLEHFAAEVVLAETGVTAAEAHRE